MADTQRVMYGSCKLTNSTTAITAVGQMIAVSTGATPLGYVASDTASRRVVGVNEYAVAASGELVAQSGIWLLDNSSVYPVTQAYIGARCYVEDSTTVSVSTGTNSLVAGTVVDVVSAGVYVRIGDCVTLS